MTTQEKIHMDNNACNRLTGWIEECQKDNVIPALLLGFGNDSSPDGVTVITPPEYPLRFIALLLQGALDKVQADLTQQAPEPCHIVRA